MIPKDLSIPRLLLSAIQFNRQKMAPFRRWKFAGKRNVNPTYTETHSSRQMLNSAHLLSVRPNADVDSELSHWLALGFVSVENKTGYLNVAFGSLLTFNMSPKSLRNVALTQTLAQSCRKLYKVGFRKESYRIFHLHKLNTSFYFKET